MPINIPAHLPAKEILENENIFVMDENRAYSQDIRPLNIAIFNIMPKKEEAETQLLRLLSNSPLQINVTLLHPSTHQSKTTSAEHLQAFYKTLPEIEQQNFDGMIITGAPIEHLDFQEVNYWDEFTYLMDWTKTHVTSTLHSCWGAQAGLFYHYDIPKHKLEQKCFGVYSHNIVEPNCELLRGFDDRFYVPHSRHMTTTKEDILQVDDLMLLAESEKAGVCLVQSKDRKQVFLTGHPEYDTQTLQNEYKRDVTNGMNIQLPDYECCGGPSESVPLHMWRAHAYLLFTNWLNYYVYQATPYQW
ncbi:homoserine O-succinyltransferase [Bacillaceae bacterium SIJ1]|uniref:homoserine O-acetyltransferase MetA n=1 Tax=Litoribacterium kuwaitense TaxID=1398745 RepID=UPI0013ECE691|nr:homoserine O-succinyltransferase [Litoribacterium kuwaitense]NGP43769.1 homoserine O-succinyltransferase [Litoribacterium kuwaitense]